MIVAREDSSPPFVPLHLGGVSNDLTEAETIRAVSKSVSITVQFRIVRHSARHGRCIVRRHRPGIHMLVVV